MAPIRRFSAEEKGKASQEGPTRSRRRSGRSLAAATRSLGWRRRGLGTSGHLMGFRYLCTPRMRALEKKMPSGAARTTDDANKPWRCTPLLLESMPWTPLVSLCSTLRCLWAPGSAFLPSSPSTCRREGPSSSGCSTPTAVPRRPERRLKLSLRARST